MSHGQSHAPASRGLGGVGEIGGKSLARAGETGSLNKLMFICLKILRTPLFLTRNHRWMLEVGSSLLDVPLRAQLWNIQEGTSNFQEGTSNFQEGTFNFQQGTFNGRFA